jgi:integrase
VLRRDYHSSELACLSDAYPLAALPQARLTKTAVESASLGAKDVYLWDLALNRFGVRLRPSGSRIYLVQYRSPLDKTKTRRIVIGRHGAPWSVEKARDAAKKLLAAVDLGRDPFAEREAEAERKRAEAAALEEAQLAEAEALTTGAFEKVAERFIEHYHKPRNRGWRNVKYSLDRDAVPAWRGRALRDLRRTDIVQLIDSVQLRAPGAARTLFSHLRRLFGWAAERGEIEQSPMMGMKSPPLCKPRDRILDDIELKRVWAAAGVLGHPFGRIVQLLMLTAQRREEVAAMRWEELDLAAGVWTVPAERCKNGKAHSVDLAPKALEILKCVPRVSPFVFNTRGETSPSGFSKAKLNLDDIIERAGGAALRPWRLHDLRRTAATGMAALGYAPHIIERVLNHISGAQGGLVAVYQHYQYRPERREALFAWAAHVDAVVQAPKKALLEAEAA